MFQLFSVSIVCQSVLMFGWENLVIGAESSASDVIKHEADCVQHYCVQIKLNEQITAKI